jgi:beta-N-acetylhexosaminidase
MPRTHHNNKGGFTMRDYSGKPFYLDASQTQWVRDTFSQMTTDQKIGQLFCLIAYESDEPYLETLFQHFEPGGVMLRPMPLTDVLSSVRYLQTRSPLPMLLAANLEKGGSGAVKEGTNYASPMEVAATDDVRMAERLGEICGREGYAVGLNWSFAPIIDIDYNFRNPITNTRTFGSDPVRVRAMGEAYVRAVQRNGLAASIKHFPGDGCDERDQHLVTSVNNLSCDAWDETYGAAYRQCIEAGAMTVMIGHIMQPAYSRRLAPGIEDRDILPASLSYELVTELLKRKLGFGGLVVTDASTMAGMSIAMPRRKAVPQSIAAGCDMFLFTRNLEEDFGYMKAGVEDGTITPERLNDAVLTILALKAALRLPERRANGTLVPAWEAASAAIGTPEHLRWAQECAQKAITLVKEETGVLPLSPARTPRVLLYPIESEQGVMYSVAAGVVDAVEKRIAAEGFSVTRFQPSKGLEGMMTTQKEFVERYDLILYLANMATKSNQTTVRIEWAQPMGVNVPVMMHSIPTIFISVENPYHLLDVPRVRTFINAYHSNAAVLDAIVDKLLGRAPFVGVNPVDPFCDLWDAKCGY